ncbi:hypothetical protein HPB50_024155 [Hyalomma asiaticum]|uniref:Uncharacterized protein n=1 Tax=Hyalomma asiaticum TaxID=266040 RepID=A0ACB7S8Z2_HYAAI|nr:hypothetical protein HPB50_024155 [Hyalomma asiaticum]
MALSLENSVLTSPWEAASPGTSTGPLPIKELRTTAAPCGLVSGATAQSSNPVTFAPQVFVLAISRVLLPVLSTAATQITSASPSLGNGYEAQASNQTTPFARLEISTSPDRMALSLENSVLTSPWEAASPGTS